MSDMWFLFVENVAVLEVATQNLFHEENSNDKDEDDDDDDNDDDSSISDDDSWPKVVRMNCIMVYTQDFKISAWIDHFCCYQIKIQLVWFMSCLSVVNESVSTLLTLFSTHKWHSVKICWFLLVLWA